MISISANSFAIDKSCSTAHWCAAVIHRPHQRSHGRGNRLPTNKLLSTGKDFPIDQVQRSRGNYEYDENPGKNGRYGSKTARRLFDEKTQRGRYLAFIEGPGGDGVTMLRHFDPNAQSIILAPRLIGG